MIRSVTIRRFKRFESISFDLNGRHVVLAGPNNMGKPPSFKPSLRGPWPLQSGKNGMIFRNMAVTTPRCRLPVRHFPPFPFAAST